MPTVHPCCVLDGRCTLGADAHDLLLSEQTRSFITHNLESLFYSAWALMLLLTHKNGISAFWFEARAESGRRTAQRLQPSLCYWNPRHVRSTKYASIFFFCLASFFLFFLKETYLFVCTLKQEAITPKASFCLEEIGLFMIGRLQLINLMRILGLCESVCVCFTVCVLVSACELHSRQKTWKGL